LPILIPGQGRRRQSPIRGSIRDQPQGSGRGSRSHSQASSSVAGAVRRQGLRGLRPFEHVGLGRPHVGRRDRDPGCRASWCVTSAPAERHQYICSARILGGLRADGGLQRVRRHVLALLCHGTPTGLRKVDQPVLSCGPMGRTRSRRARLLPLLARLLPARHLAPFQRLQTGPEVK
jgi:hypothetical protein